MKLSNLLLDWGFMKYIPLTITAVLSVMLLGCVQVPQEQASKQNQLAISSVRDIPVSYSADSVFALSPKYVQESSLTPEQTQAAYHFYAQALIDNLQAHGFSRAVALQKPDFYVGFGVALEADLSDQTINEKFGVTPGLPKHEGLDKGSILIYIEDVQTGKKVWRGTAQGFAHQDLDKKQREIRAKNVVAAVMKQFYATN